jgi:hypothetical protein
MPSMPLILSTTHATIEDYTTPATPGEPIDVSCHVISIEPSGDTEMVDTPVFCDPSSQGEGTTTYELAINWAVSIDGTDSLAELVAPLVGKTVRVTWWADGGTHAEQVICGLPINPALVGTWNVGERVESSTTHAIRTTPQRITAPVEVLTTEATTGGAKAKAAA